MSERDIRRFSGGIKGRAGARVVIVDAPTRHESTGSFPPLLEDTKANHLVSVEGDNVRVYVKPVAGPYTGKDGNHFLVVPDAKNGDNVPTIQDLSSRDLGTTLQLAQRFAQSTLEEAGITEVDFGFHAARVKQDGPKQKNVTFPDHLHVHVTGYSENDMQPISVDNPDILGKTGEALHFLTEELFINEIIPEIEDTTAFDEIFEQTKDERGRLRFKMQPEGFQDQQFPVILQEIDSRAKKAYDDVAKCFFEYDEGNESFVEKDDQYKRYALLPVEERIANIRDYIGEREWLSDGGKMGLLLLAKNAQDADAIMARELAKPDSNIAGDKTDYRSGTSEQQAANRFFAYKDLAYTMVWSARKDASNATTEWLFGFDPMIFTVEGVPQSSSYTDKIILKKKEAFAPDELAAVRDREVRIVDKVVENSTYQRGKIPTEI